VLIGGLSSYYFIGIIVLVLCAAGGIVIQRYRRHKKRKQMLAIMGFDELGLHWADVYSTGDNLADGDDGIGRVADARLRPRLRVRGAEDSKDDVNEFRFINPSLLPYPPAVASPPTKKDQASPPYTQPQRMQQRPFRAPVRQAVGLSTAVTHVGTARTSRPRLPQTGIGAVSSGGDHSPDTVDGRRRLPYDDDNANYITKKPDISGGISGMVDIARESDAEMLAQQYQLQRFILDKLRPTNAELRMTLEMPVKLLPHDVNQALRAAGLLRQKETRLLHSVASEYVNENRDLESKITSLANALGGAAGGVRVASKAPSLARVQAGDASTIGEGIEGNKHRRYEQTSKAIRAKRLLDNMTTVRSMQARKLQPLRGSRNMDPKSGQKNASKGSALDDDKNMDDGGYEDDASDGSVISAMTATVFDPQPLEKVKRHAVTGRATADVAAAAGHVSYLELEKFMYPDLDG
jgi:hypothetical protein